MTVPLGVTMRTYASGRILSGKNVLHTDPRLRT